MDENLREMIDIGEFVKMACDKRNSKEFVRMIKSGLENGTRSVIGLKHFGLSDSYLAYFLQRIVDYFGNRYNLPDIEKQEIDEMRSKVWELNEFFEELYDRSVVDFTDLLNNALNDGKILRFPKDFDYFPYFIYGVRKTVGKGKNRYTIVGKEDLVQTYTSNKRCVIDVKDLIQNVLYTGKIINFDHFDFCVADDLLNRLGLKYQALIFLESEEVEQVEGAYFMTQSQDMLDKNADVLRAYYYLLWLVDAI